MGFTRNENNYPIIGSGEWLEQFADGRIMKESQAGEDYPGANPDESAQAYKEPDVTKPPETPNSDPAADKHPDTEQQSMPQTEPSSDLQSLNEAVANAKEFIIETLKVANSIASKFSQIGKYLFPQAKGTIQSLIELSQNYLKIIDKFEGYATKQMPTVTPAVGKSNKNIKTAGLFSGISDSLQQMLSNLGRGSRSIKDFYEIRKQLSTLLDQGRKMQATLEGIPIENFNLNSTLLKYYQNLLGMQSQIVTHINDLVYSYENTSIKEAREAQIAFKEDQKNQALTSRVQEGVEQSGGDGLPGISPPIADPTKQEPPAAGAGSLGGGTSENVPLNKAAIINGIRNNIINIQNIFANINLDILQNHPDESQIIALYNDSQKVAHLLSQINSKSTRAIEEIQIEEI